MANDEHLKILKSGVYEWNTWMRHGGGGRLSSADLSHANFSGVNLSGANLSGANLSGANLSRTNLSRASLFDGHLSRANLNTAILCYADLARANLGMASLCDADLSHAKLSGANLWNVNLYRANLFFADLSGAIFIGADLTGAILSEADLTGANLSGADLTDTDFSRAILGRTTLGDCDLRLTRGLNSIDCKAPCTIGVDAIYQSEGRIPESFLRDCGIPESFITQMPSLVGAEEGMQFHSCFISYSHKDEEFAKRLHERMRAANLRVWFAPEDVEGGKKLHEQFETQIHIYDKLLLILSEHSMKSEWVATEIYHARQREKKEKRQILFPIALCPFETIRKWKAFDAGTGKDMAREVREYFIPDFSSWKDHDQFEAGFAKLLKDLRSQKGAS